MNESSPSRAVTLLFLAVEPGLARGPALRPTVALPPVAAQAHEEALVATAAEQLQQRDLVILATARVTSHVRPEDGRNVDCHRDAGHKPRQRLVTSANRRARVFRPGPSSSHVLRVYLPLLSRLASSLAAVATEPHHDAPTEVRRGTGRA